MKKVKLFYSYAHEDEKYRKQLEDHLKSLEREGVLEGWHDRMIMRGEEWGGEIDENLETADIILLLVSASFLASDYIYEIEMKRAMERHRNKEAVVIPVMVRRVSFRRAPFAGLQALPKDAEPVANWEDADSAWTDVTEGIIRVIESIQKSRKVVVPAGRVGQRVTIGFKFYSFEIDCAFRRLATLGRSEECDIPLRLAPNDVSNVHAQFEHLRQRGEFEVCDLDSKNGVYVNGRRLDEPQSLRPGDEVVLGKSLRFVFEQAEVPEPCGALTYFEPGGKELARYLLCPGKAIRLGNGPGYAARVPMLPQGRCLGVVERRTDGLYFQSDDADADAGAVEVRLEDGMDLQLHPLTLRITLP